MSVPAVTTTASSLKFNWEEEQLIILVSRLHNHSDGRVTGEIDIKTTAPSTPPHLHRCLFNFAASRARKELATILGNRYAIEWDAILEQVCYHTLEHIRRGEPVEELWTGEDVAPVEYLIKPFLPAGQPTVFFGEGGTAKSFLALFLAICVELSWDENPLSLEVKYPGAISLYLDYESDARELHYRGRCLKNGLELPDFRLHYRRCYLPLADDLEQLQALIAESNVKFLVVDSVGAACGGDLNAAETAIRLFNALRSLKVTSLLLAHTSKDFETKRKSIFGTVFFTNFARSVWEVRKAEEEENEISIGLFHRKSNVSRLHPPVGLKLCFSDEDKRVEVKPEDVKSVAEFVEQLHTGQRIVELLKHGTKSLKEIAGELSLPTKTVSVSLFRLKAKKIVIKIEEKWGLLAKGD